MTTITAFADIETHRATLRAHCQRMLGSASDADDAVQETMVRAWRSIESFDGRASLKTWLKRIATNVCRDALSERIKRSQPLEGTALDRVASAAPSTRTHWLVPVTAASSAPSIAAASDVAEQLVQQQRIRDAISAMLQWLPPKQRVALLLMEVLGWTAADVAKGLDGSVASVNSALQRARATLAEREDDELAELSAEQASLLERYVLAFERDDVFELAAVLRDDAAFEMSPTEAAWMRRFRCYRASMASKLLGVDRNC